MSVNPISDIRKSDFGYPISITSVNFDNPTKLKYAAERYQMFLWIFDKKIRENAKNRHFLAQNGQIDNDFW